MKDRTCPSASRTALLHRLQKAFPIGYPLPAGSRNPQKNETASVNMNSGLPVKSQQEGNGLLPANIAFVLGYIFTKGKRRMPSFPNPIRLLLCQNKITNSEHYPTLVFSPSSLSLIRSRVSRLCRATFWTHPPCWRWSDWRSCSSQLLP